MKSSGDDWHRIELSSYQLVSWTLLLVIMIKIAQWEIIGKWGSKARYGFAKHKYDYVYNMYLIMSFLKMKKMKILNSIDFCFYMTQI